MLDVYVGNLPGRVSTDDLRDLFSGVTESSLASRLSWTQNLFSLVRKAPQAAELSFTMVDASQGHPSRYCRVSGYSRSNATQVIEQLTGAGLHGKTLEIRPFYPRILTNDRRRAGWRFRRWLGVERRLSERRGRVWFLFGGLGNCFCRAARRNQSENSES